ncbi:MULTISPECIES: hypothetical protein [Streptomyces]|uniref:Lipoprotein n=2 Tax=Streptomyces TaxID=1883 RepID=A0ABS9JNU8_9ACTN|nr:MULTISPECIES: hypothetical protein [Streptomyces]MCG0067241.1 hypothetical protein [Streptomyces tricolor]OYP17882.1 hypothetical protein CFC35_28120 [Streptomyces sp. FBKL.4005]BCM66587.1 putative secreted protein [Streptomyces sp. EAS-AB2608]CUW28171.1 hypothetical protein TUE45_02901 [Streptomyces reticuli]
MPVPIRRLFVALTLCCALVAGATACGGGEKSSTKDTAAVEAAPAVDTPTPTPTTSAERQKFAKTRFVANAGLAAGATYQWIVKPWKAGKFKKGAQGRRLALVKAGLAGAFAYNRLKAAHRNAQGDPTLSKALAPLGAGIEALKDLPAKLRQGDEAAASAFDDVINQVKDAGQSAGAPVKEQVPSASQLAKG